MHPETFLENSSSEGVLIGKLAKDPASPHWLDQWSRKRVKLTWLGQVIGCDGSPEAPATLDFGQQITTFLDPSWVLLPNYKSFKTAMAV